jgi:hypothetical protein
MRRPRGPSGQRLDQRALTRPTSRATTVCPRNDETGEYSSVPKRDPAPSRARDPPSYEFVLPTAQDRVGQDARTKQQRGRGQKDGRTTAHRERRARGFRYRRRHLGGALRKGYRRQNQHDQKSSRSQEILVMEILAATMQRLALLDATFYSIGVFSPTLTIGTLLPHVRCSLLRYLACL